MNEAFLFLLSFGWEGPGVGAVGRATTARTVLFFIASRIFAWSSALSKKVTVAAIVSGFGSLTPTSAIPRLTPVVPYQRLQESEA